MVENSVSGSCMPKGGLNGGVAGADLHSEDLRAGRRGCPVWYTAAEKERGQQIGVKRRSRGLRSGHLSLRGSRWDLSMEGRRLWMGWR